MPFTASDICKIILGTSSLNGRDGALEAQDRSGSVLLPPLGVFLERGCAADFWINVLLTILGYIPGIIHALYIILKY
ncbi:plasma membrane proteolipid Pmp3 [Microbotryomycetes sp. NB124-2]